MGRLTAPVSSVLTLVSKHQKRYDEFMEMRKDMIFTEADAAFDAIAERIAAIDGYYDWSIEVSKVREALEKLNSMENKSNESC